MGVICLSETIVNIPGIIVCGIGAHRSESTGQTAGSHMEKRSLGRRCQGTKVIGKSRCPARFG